MSTPNQPEPQTDPQVVVPAAPQPGSVAPPTPATPEPPQPRSSGTGGNPFNAEAAFRQLSDTLTALPEKLVDAVRETGTVNPPAPVVNPPATETAKKKTFGDWWFGN